MSTFSQHLPASNGQRWRDSHLFNSFQWNDSDLQPRSEALEDVDLVLRFRGCLIAQTHLKQITNYFDLGLVF